MARWCRSTTRPTRQPMARTPHHAPSSRGGSMRRATRWWIFVTGLRNTPVIEHRLLTFYAQRSEEHTSELQSLMRISYAVFCLQKKKKQHRYKNTIIHQHQCHNIYHRKTDNYESSIR